MHEKINWTKVRNNIINGEPPPVWQRTGEKIKNVLNFSHPFTTKVRETAQNVGTFAGKEGVKYVKNLNPIGRERLWYAGAALGVAESVVLMPLLPVGGTWAKGIINMAGMQLFYAAARKGLVKSDDVKTVFQGISAGGIYGSLGVSLATDLLNFHLPGIPGADHGTTATTTPEPSHSPTPGPEHSPTPEPNHSPTPGPEHTSTPTAGETTSTPDHPVTPGVPEHPVTPETPYGGFGTPEVPHVVPEIPISADSFTSKVAQFISDNKGNPEIFTQHVVPSGETAGDMLVNMDAPVSWDGLDWQGFAVLHELNPDAFTDLQSHTGLSTEEFNELIAKIKLGDEGAYHKLIEKMGGIRAGAKITMLTAHGMSKILTFLGSK